jgi:hypothetical protein
MCQERLWAVEARQGGKMRELDGKRGVRLEVKAQGACYSAKPGDCIVRWPTGELEVCPDHVFRKRCAALPRPLRKKSRTLAYPCPGSPTSAGKNGRAVLLT